MVGACQVPDYSCACQPPACQSTGTHQFRQPCQAHLLLSLKGNMVQARRHGCQRPPWYQVLPGGPLQGYIPVALHWRGGWGVRRQLPVLPLAYYRKYVGNTTHDLKYFLLCVYISLCVGTYSFSGQRTTRVPFLMYYPSWCFLASR